MTGKLTPARVAILRRAIYGRHGGPDLGVVQPAFHVGFEAVTERKNLAWLTAEGFLQANPHGDWYITDKGKEAAGVDATGQPL